MRVPYLSGLLRGVENAPLRVVLYVFCVAKLNTTVYLRQHAQFPPAIDEDTLRLSCRIRASLRYICCGIGI